MPSASSNTRILVVDDEAPFREVLAAALVTQGHCVEVVGDGHAAERRLRSESFDLIITDVLMPNEDGLQMIMNLQAANDVTPIIAMTGTHMYTELYLKTAKALGARRVLSKPFGMRELIETTCDVLRETAPGP